MTTVSRGLAGYPDVAKTTQERIRAAAKKAQYVPNSAGKMLVTGKSGFVGFLLPFRGSQLLDPFLGEFISGVSEGLVNRGRDLFLATAPSSQPEFDVLKHVVESGRADGMILTRLSEDDERVSYLQDRRFPFIAHGRVLNSDAQYSWVDTDGELAFGEAFDLLYGLGHRRFALLSILEPMTFKFFRERGLEQAILQRNDPAVSLVTRHAPRFDTTETNRNIVELLRLEKRPTAILALTDEIALSVLEQAAALNIRVPEQLSVIGFDNLPAAEYAPPGLTTFDQSIQATAHEIADTLLDIVDGKTQHQHHLVRPQLITRGSHGPVPSSLAK